MSNNITTLVLNLLIAESKLHRIRIADRILELLNDSETAETELENLMRSHFISQINNCVENPTGKNRESLFKTSNFYTKFYVGYVPEILAQAA